MSYLVLIIACIALICVFEVLGRLWNKSRRAVTKFTSVAQMLDFAVVPWTLHGWGGTRTVIYHQPSGLMVQVIKSLHPPRARDGKVNLRVANTRIRNPAAYCMDGGWAVSLKGGLVCRCIPTRKVPSPYEAEVVEDVDCGSSMSKTEDVVRRMLSKEHIVDDKFTLYVWSEKGGSSYVLGKFQE